MGLAFAHGKPGLRDKTMEYIRKMEQRQAEEPDSAIDADLASAWFALDDYDKTFYYINQCVDKRMGRLNYFIEHPGCKEIKIQSMKTLKRD